MLVKITKRAGRCAQLGPEGNAERGKVRGKAGKDPAKDSLSRKPVRRGKGNPTEKKGSKGSFQWEISCDRSRRILGRKEAKEGAHAHREMLSKGERKEVKGSLTEEKLFGEEKLVPRAQEKTGLSHVMGSRLAQEEGKNMLKKSRGRIEEMARN